MKIEVKLSWEIKETNGVGVRGEERIDGGWSNVSYVQYLLVRKCPQVMLNHVQMNITK